MRWRKIIDTLHNKLLILHIAQDGAIFFPTIRLLTHCIVKIFNNPPVYLSNLQTTQLYTFVQMLIYKCVLYGKELVSLNKRDVSICTLLLVLPHHFSITFTLQRVEWWLEVLRLIGSGLVLVKRARMRGTIITHRPLVEREKYRREDAS